MGIAVYRNVAMPLSTRGINFTHEHFQMRFVTLFQLKGLKSYHQPKENYKVCFTIETSNSKGGGNLLVCLHFERFLDINETNLKDEKISCVYSYITVDNKMIRI